MFKKLILLFFTIIFTVIGFEVLLQLFDYPDSRGRIVPKLVPHKLYHHFHLPNTSYIHHLGYSNREQKVFFNSEGLNDLPRIPGLPKIVFIGDSFVEARQVDIREMFGNLVEKQLGKLDIINVGCSSWTSFMYCRWLEENLSKIKGVKSVYLFYFANDAYDTLRYLKDADNPEELDNITFHAYYRKKYKFKRRIRIWFKKYSKLYFLKWQFMTKLKQEMKKKKGLMKSKEEKKYFLDYTHFTSLYAGVKTEYQKEAVEKDNYFLLKIKELLKARDISFNLVYIPQAQQVGLEENAEGSKFYSKEMRDLMYHSTFFQNRFKSLARENNFSFIDLTPELKKYKKEHPSKLLYTVFDGHFSKAGHEAVAEILVKTLSVA